MKYMCFSFVLISLSFVAGLYVGIRTHYDDVSFTKDSIMTSSGIPMSYEKRETGFPNMPHQFRVGNFAIFTSDDYSSFAFAKWPLDKQVSALLLMEGVIDNNPNEVTSNYFGFGGDPSDFISITADKNKGIISNIACSFPEKLSYPYEHSPTRYHYIDFDGDGLWDTFIDFKERKGYKRDDLTWVLTPQNTEPNDETDEN